MSELDSFEWIQRNQGTRRWAQARGGRAVAQPGLASVVGESCADPLRFRWKIDR